MKRVLVIVLLLVSSGAYAQKPEYALVRYDAHNAFYQNNEIFPEGAQPAPLTEAEIAKVKTLLNDCIGNYNSKQKGLFIDDFRLDSADASQKYLINLKDYKLQLVAAKDKKEEKVVYVNAFCSAPPATWTKELFMNFDGGKCYFQLMVNVTANKYTDFVLEEQR
jgi:hypothetical protein